MLTLRIALRYLVSKKTHSAVNVISGISVAGVAVATMAIVWRAVGVQRFYRRGRRPAVVSVARPEGREPHGQDDSRRRLAVPPAENCGGGGVGRAYRGGTRLAIYEGRQMPVMLKGVTEEYRNITAIDDIVKEDGRFMPG